MHDVADLRALIPALRIQFLLPQNQRRNLSRNHDVAGEAVEVSLHPDAPCNGTVEEEAEYNSLAPCRMQRIRDHRNRFVLLFRLFGQAVVIPQSGPIRTGRNGSLLGIKGILSENIMNGRDDFICDLSGYDKCHCGLSPSFCSYEHN